MPELLPVNTQYFIAKQKKTLCGNGIDRLPAKTEYGDEFYTNDYTYSFFSQWTVAVRDKTKKSYTAIPREINGLPITNIGGTFEGCAYLEEAPIIPDSVKNMEKAFAGCKSLTAAPAIPAGIENLRSTFAGCWVLEGYLICQRKTPLPMDQIAYALHGTKITNVMGKCGVRFKKMLLSTR